MARYRYKAVNMIGETITGEYEAVDLETVKDIIRGRGYYPIEVREIRISRWKVSLSSFSRIPLKTLALFCKQFAAIIKAGVPMVQALEIMQQQIDHSRLKKSLKAICREVQTGKSLSESMAMYPAVFPVMLIDMINVGEVSGTLDLSLQRMADVYEKEYKLKQKIVNALTYPSIVAIIAFSVVIFLLMYVVPTFVGLFSSANISLPLPTRILLDIVEFFKRYGIWVIMVLTALGLWAVTYIYGGNGRRWLDSIKLKVPIWGLLNKKIISSRFARILATLLTSGIPLTQSLSILKGIMANKIIEENIDSLINAVERGEGLAASMERINMFLPMVWQMVRVGEESGSLDTMLDHVADFLELEVDHAVARLTAMIEPAIILIMGCVVGFIVISIAMPIFTMLNIVQ